MDPFPTNPYYDPKMPISFWRGSLPHFEQFGKIHFVTFRLLDSLPSPVVYQYREIKERFMREHPQPWDESTYHSYGELVKNPLERYIDAGYGECVLANPEARQILMDALGHYDGKKYQILADVIMPNHVHMLVVPATGCFLVATLKSVMKYSATCINRLLHRKGRLWQTEPYDMIVRSYSQYIHCLDYIRYNPDGLPPGSYCFGGVEFR